MNVNVRIVEIHVEIPRGKAIQLRHPSTQERKFIWGPQILVGHQLTEGTRTWVVFPAQDDWRILKEPGRHADGKLEMADETLKRAFDDERVEQAWQVTNGQRTELFDD